MGLGGKGGLPMGGGNVAGMPGGGPLGTTPAGLTLGGLAMMKAVSAPGAWKVVPTEALK